jgi:hypothetical protein
MKFNQERNLEVSAGGVANYGHSFSGTCLLSILKLSFIIFLVAMVSGKSNAQDLENIAKQKPVTLTGGISARALFYNADGIANRRKPFSYVFSGSPTLNLYSITIPFSFVYSEQERAFRQPFNQFGMSPYYKWVTVHAGYRNLNFSPYTLGGHTILGAGFELKPGILRMGFMYGRLNKATAVDTTTGSFDPYSYTRRGYAAKIGIGKGSNFLDFSVLKAKDDSSSISSEERKVGRVKPAENVVFGVSTRLSFKSFFFEADGGLSLYTNNLGTPFQELDSLPSILTGTLGKFITINATSEFYSAYNVGVGYRLKDWSLKIQYKRIDPDFKSMGTYFFNNDLENITISPTFSALKHRVNFSGSIGFQKDNLQNQKESTSKRVIGMGNLNINFTDQFGVDASFTNFSTNQKPGRVFVSDSFLITQTTKNISVTPRLIIPKTNYTHVFLLSWNYMNLVDLNDLTSEYNNLNSTNFFFNYQVTIVPRNLTLSLNLNSTNLEMSVGTSSNKGVTLGINKSFLENRFSAGINSSIAHSESFNSKSLLLNNGLMATFRANKHHSFNTNINYIGNYPSSSSSTENPRFREFRGELAYLFNF